MKDEALPYDLSRRWGDLPDITYRGRQEWSSCCPKCGGAGHRHDKSDRFRMFQGDQSTGARGWCRQCGFFAWADDDQKPPSREEMEAANRERARLAQLERERMRLKIVAIQQAAYWRGWHDAMSQQQRDLWHKEGIVDWAIEEYKLGYCPDHTTYYDGAEWHTPTMTIPHWGKGWELVNIQHRLLNPPEPGDKYRQTAGLPAAMFLTEPDSTLEGAVLVVEGAKKAIVSVLHIGGNGLKVVGLPGKTPSGEMIDQLEKCEPVYLCLDPDAYMPIRTKDGKMLEPAAKRIGAKLGNRARFVRLPGKPDDLLNGGILTAERFKKYLNQSTRAL